MVMDVKKSINSDNRVGGNSSGEGNAEEVKEVNKRSNEDDEAKDNEDLRETK